MTFSFRNRLAAFLMATLVVVQGTTALTVYGVTRRALISQSEHQLTVSTELFLRQINELSVRVAESVQVLSLDYALRRAVAEQNEQTVLSALRNHGRRVGATRMLWIGMDGLIRADTGESSAVGQPFDSPGLLDQAVADGRARDLTIVKDKAYWVVLVPVLAPIPIGYIGANIPLDDAMVDELRRLSSLPREVVLAAQQETGDWQVLAESLPSADLVDQLLPNHKPPPFDQPVLMHGGSRQDIVLAIKLPARKTDTIIAVVGLSLDDALKPYDPVILAASLLLLGGLFVALFGTSLIARSVSKPIEALAMVARRIAGGDYTPPEPSLRTKEIVQLSGALANMAVAIRDREAHIRYQARHDVITGLPNRLSLTDVINQDLAERPRMPASLLMVGVPRVQEIVNTLGHDFRDRLMRFVGERVRLAGADGQVARVSDIAFALWLPTAQDALDMAQNLVKAVGENFREGDVTVDVATAIGIALVPDHGGEARLLLQHADTALHDALVKADDRVVIYDPGRDPHRSERLSLMSDLREALELGSLQLHCQPKIDLAANVVAGAEGLVRWTHPVRGFVPPDSFIQLAEETGNIRRLTHWVLETGIHQAAQWRRRGLKLRLSVNLSVRDLGDPTLPDRVAETLKRHEVDPSAMVLEITESAIMGEPDTAIAVLRRLANMGIDLSIDDFGVGQSSFAYLRRLPVREIKIDKSFVLKVTDSPEDATIVRSIVDLGHSLGYKVTAEGVEDEGSFAFLRDIGCDYAQGFYIAKALPQKGFDSFMTDGRWPVREIEAAS